MTRFMVLLSVCACLGCASSGKGRRGGGNEEKALAAARAENAKLRGELSQAHKDAQLTFNEASATQARPGTNGCAAVT
ncbi:MAG: hypothetical protein KY452_13965, partial [Actinobacteria bacterium]|nr:hypothetical protein [Actinomycetota bacterium]